MKLSDFKGIFNKSTLRVVSVENPYEDYYVIKLEADADIKWQAGEHGIFTLPNQSVEGKKWRGFSIASIDEEGYVLLGTRTGKEISSFKKNLIHMKEGDNVSMRGPFGWFKIQDKTSPIVMFAGGVGITPIRAIAKALEDDSSRPVEIVYASSDFYLFGEEMERLALNNPAIKLHKTITPEETSSLISKLAKEYGNSAYYYNSGSPKAIKSLKDVLKGEGIDKKRMIDDSFLGY